MDIEHDGGLRSEAIERQLGRVDTHLQAIFAANDIAPQLLQARDSRIARWVKLRRWITLSLVSSPLALSPYRLASFACPLWYSACRLERILEERLRDSQWKLLTVPDGKAEDRTEEA